MIIKAPIDLELTQNSGQTSQPPWKLDNNIYSDVVVADNKAVLFQVKQKENNLDFNFIGDISNKEATKKIKTIFDLDFNHHMNNIKYTAFAINTVSNEYLATHEIKSYKIKFIKECFFDDEIKCQFFESKEHSFFIQTRKSDNAVVCKIETIVQNK